MKKFFYLLSFFILFAFCRVLSAASLHLRGADSLATSSTWTSSGDLFTVTESSANVAYQPMRRHVSGETFDRGCVKKYSFVDVVTGANSFAWQSSTSFPRNILRPIFEGSAPKAGEAQSLETFEENAADYFGVDEDGWAAMADELRNKAMGAPYPPSMVLVDNLLYFITDDGMLCALDKDSGVEKWALLLPSACSRIVQALDCERNALPWVASGNLSAEDADEKTLLCGTYGAAARGIFCLDISGDVPSLLWNLEEDDSSTSELGFSDSAPLLVSLSGTLTAFVASGAGASASLLLYNALTGAPGDAAAANVGELILSPTGLTGSDGTLTYVICADSQGGVNYFSRDGASFDFDRRIDLESICGLGTLNFEFSPTLASTSRGLWLLMIAAHEAGLVVAAAPARKTSLSWSELPWRGSGYGWWRSLDGFSDPFAALVYDDLLYLLGWQSGSKTLVVVDLTPAQLETAVVLEDDVIGLTVADGQVLTVTEDGATQMVSDMTGSCSVMKNGILYTLED